MKRSEMIKKFIEKVNSDNDLEKTDRLETEEDWADYLISIFEGLGMEPPLGDNQEHVWSLEHE